MNITKNMCICTACGDLIESKYRHDYRPCKCGACTTDGGTDYLHRSGVSIDVSEYDELRPTDYILQNGKYCLAGKEKEGVHATVVDYIHTLNNEELERFTTDYLYPVGKEKMTQFLQLRLTKELVKYFGGKSE